MKKVFAYLFCCIILVGCNGITAPSSTATLNPTKTPNPMDTSIIEDKGAIKLVTGEWSPYTTENLLDKGMAVEIVKLIFAEMGQEIQIDFRHWERNLEETKANIYFATFPWISNKEREPEFFFSEIIFYANTHFFVRADSDITFTTLESLTGRTLCHPQEWALYGLEDMVAAGKINIERPAEAATCLRMLEARRVDMILNDPLVISTLSQDTEILFNDNLDFDIKMLEKPVDIAGYRLLVSKSYPQGEQLLAEFNQALAKLQAEGKVEAIIDKYMITFQQTE